MKKLLFGSLAVLAFIVFACSEGQNDDQIDPVTPAKMVKPKLAIEGASSLVVLSSNSSGRAASEGSNLYKITASGSFEMVTFLNEDNTPIDSSKTHTTVLVRDLFEVNKDYLVLQGYFEAWDTLGNSQQYYALLVRKSDGAIYDFDMMDISDHLIFQDENENFYYRNGNNMVMQVDVSNPDVLKKIEYLPTGQIAGIFGVDKKGHVFYSYAEDKFRLRKKNGGIYELNLAKDNHYVTQGMWIGVNGKMYLETVDSEPLGYKYKLRPHFHTISLDDQGTVIIDTVWTGEWTEWYGGTDYVVGIGSSFLMWRVHKEHSILFVDMFHAWEFFEETNTLVEVSLPHVEHYDEFFYSDNYLYYRSGLAIYKISLADYSYELMELPQDDQFEIYSMSIGASETLQLSMLRFSDGKKIIAQIDSNGIFSVLSEVLNREAILLQRLN